jgi:hypothetical protein
MKKLVLLMMMPVIILASSCVDNNEYKQTIRRKYPNAIIVNGENNIIQCTSYIVIDTVNRGIRQVEMRSTSNKISSDFLIQKY